MQIQEDVISRGGKHPPQTKTEFNNCFIITCIKEKNRNRQTHRRTDHSLS